jgi:hypothetical protein
MKKSDMTDYMRLEMWIDRVRETIVTWEKLQGIEVPIEIKDTITKFLRPKIKRGIEKGTLLRTFMQIAVTSLIYIKMKGWDK